jgi:hypothetical protein
MSLVVLTLTSDRNKSHCSKQVEDTVKGASYTQVQQNSVEGQTSQHGTRNDSEDENQVQTQSETEVQH